MTPIRLWWRGSRRLVLLAAAVVAVVAIAGIARAATLTCPSEVNVWQCASIGDSDPFASLATFVVALVPVLLGLLLGVDAIGGEIEAGTARLAWLIAPDRRGWLVGRIAPGLLATLAVGLVAGAMNTLVVALLHPGHALPSSFVSYGLWGPILAMRALGGYAIGVLLGQALRRVVPAVALGLLAVAILLPGALIVGRAFEPAVPIALSDPTTADALPVATGMNGPDGHPLEGPCLAPNFPDDPTGEKQLAWQDRNCIPGQTVLPGPKMSIVELRESAVLAVAVLLSGGAAFGLVGSRRP